MSDAFVQVPPQSTGLKMQTFENVVGANTVEAEAVTLVRSSDNTEVGTASQPLRVDPTGTTTQPVSGTVAVSNFPATQPISGAISFAAPQHTIVDSGSSLSASVTGTLTNNNAAPAATNIGSLTAVASASIPLWSEGDQVLLSEDLAGNLRVKINAALPIGSNVIGHVITDSGSTTAVTGVVEVAPTGAANTLSNPFFNVLADNSGHALTVNSTTTTSKFAPDQNIISILGTAPTTAGFLDIKGADGNVFVRQTTAANLNATVVGTGTFAVQATLAAETTKVIGTVNQGTSPWVIDGPAASGAAISGNPVRVAGTDGGGAVRDFAVNSSGQLLNAVQFAAADASTNGSTAFLINSGGTSAGLGIRSYLFNGSTWDRQRTASIGNNVAATGISASASYGQFNTVLPTVASGNYSAVQVDASGQQLVVAKVVGNVGGILDAAQNAAAPANELVAGGVYNTTIPALTAGNATQLQTDVTGALAVNSEGRKTTYRATAVKFTPVTSSTSPSFSLQGSGTKTVRVTQVRFSLSDATGAATPCNVQVQRFSVLSGGVTGTTPAIAKNDTNNANGTAVALTYSTLSTTATATGGVTDSFDYQLTTVSATTAPAPPPYLITFGSQPGAQELVLRGTSDYVGVILNGVGTTPICNIMIEWTEE